MAALEVTSFLCAILKENPLLSFFRVQVCRKCHQRCKNCTSYSIHVSVCECLHYSSGEQCEDRCQRDHFPDEANRRCLRCHDECRGCSGPTTAHCINCRNFRIYDSENRTQVSPDWPSRVVVVCTVLSCH